MLMQKTARGGEALLEEKEPEFKAEMEELQPEGKQLAESCT